MVCKAGQNVNDYIVTANLAHDIAIVVMLCGLASAVVLFVEEGGGGAGGLMWDGAKAVIRVDRHCARSGVGAFPRPSGSSSLSGLTVRERGQRQTFVVRMSRSYDKSYL